MADGATTVALLLSHGGRRRSGRGGLLLLLLLCPLHLSAAESECAKFAGPRARTCTSSASSGPCHAASTASPPPALPGSAAPDHAPAHAAAAPPAQSSAPSGRLRLCPGPGAPLLARPRGLKADMYGGSTSLVPSIPSGDAHPLSSNASVLYSLASSLPQVRKLQMRPPGVCINAQGGRLWRGQHVCLKERDGKEGAGVREEEGVEPHVISLSSTSSHHYRDFLG
ncbi:uncharacterized protein LOC119278309 [Triticum dicoccoides]|uniref:uncharacterized protein LOC119278309 n=1 Tax=Triticum dicoccoides TaxID=85692 RepID=UPI00188F690D|nr:uncharacterized protein LOC119278309 [Triticum dicoccoides]